MNHPGRPDWLARWLSRPSSRSLPRILGALVLLGLLHAPLAFAQYEPVNEAARERMDPNPYIVGAYGFIWAAVVLYVIMLARNLGKAQSEVENLRRRVDAGPAR